MINFFELTAALFVAAFLVYLAKRLEVLVMIRTDIRRVSRSLENHPESWDWVQQAAGSFLVNGDYTVSSFHDLGGTMWYSRIPLSLNAYERQRLSDAFTRCIHIKVANDLMDSIENPKKGDEAMREDWAKAVTALYSGGGDA